MKAHTENTVERRQPLPEFPRLIFLDTNIVQNLHTYGEFINDNSLEPAMATKLSAVGPRIAEDIHALSDFISLGQRAGWPIAVSSRTLGELGATTRPTKRVALVGWGSELAHFFTSYTEETKDQTAEFSYSELTHFTYIQRQYLSDVLKKLPDESDRQPIVDALEYGCDLFLTMDYRTVWRYREEVAQLGVQVMRPIEFMDYISPWAGLLR